MGRMMIRDNAIWAAHIHDGPEIVNRIRALPEDRPIKLVLDGKPVLFLKMRNGRDGRPTQGLKPAPDFKPYWDAMQQRRGEVVEVRLDGTVPIIDPYLASISGLLTEWNTPEDGQAYDGL